MSGGTRSILILCDDDPAHAGNVLDHLDAFERHSKHRILYVNPRIGDGGAALDLDEFDVVVIHYTIVVNFDTYLPDALAAKVAEFEGLKIQFIQDEYRWVNEITAKMRSLGIDLLFSLVPEHEVPKLYGDRLPGVDVITSLAGFVPDGLDDRQVAPTMSRPIDVGYRGRHVPYWLGRLGQDKIEIARRFMRASETRMLRRDIAWTESDRLYGDDWLRFLSDCRTTLGTESGASVADFDGRIERRVTDYMAEHPAATFDEVEHAILAPFEGNVVINVISPRVFEAAALRTGLVLYPGNYSGAVEPWTHYIPLEKDFSNIDEVVSALQDEALVTAMVDRAFDDLVASGRYSLRGFVADFDAIVDERAPDRSALRPRATYSDSTRRATRGTNRYAPPTRADLRRIAESTLSRYAIARSPEARRLRRAYERSTTARNQVPRARFEEDLAKIAALMGVQRRRLRPVMPFLVVPIVSDDRLILASRPATRPNLDAARVGARVAMERLRSGIVNEIIWNHTAIHTSVLLRVGGTALPLDVGYYGMYGVHHFSALERLERSIRAPVVQALQAAITPVEPRRPLPEHADPVVTRYPLPGILGLAVPLLVRDPRGYTARASTALRFAWRIPELKNLLRVYAGKPGVRTAVHPLELLDDLLKLALLKRFADDSHRAGTARLVVEFDAATRELILKTQLEADDVGPPNLSTHVPPAESLVWDNSELGSSLPVTRSVSASFDRDGIHRFRAVAAVCGHAEEPLESIVRAVLNGTQDQG